MYTDLTIQDDEGTEFSVGVEYDYYKPIPGTETEPYLPPEGAKVELHSVAIQDSDGVDIDLLGLLNTATLDEIERMIKREHVG
jgi:hypothetical protein